MIEIGFFIKKIIGFWILPLSICVLFIASGLILLWLKKYQKQGKYLATIGLLLLFIFSWQPTSYRLLAPIESQYSKFDNMPVDYIVVLGNEVISDSRLSPFEQLSSSARARLMEGLRIVRAQPHTKIIFSGYAGKNNKSCAEVYAQAATEFGLDASRIIKLSEPKDTHDEAISVKEIVGEKTVALVTSASHMARSKYYFDQAGVNSIAAPTFYLAKQKPYLDLKFNADGLLQSERAIHEYVGQIWQRIKD